MNARVSPDLPEDRDGFRFRGGHIALDLTATLGGRLKPEKKELLASPADLDRWLVSSKLATRPPRGTDKDLALARQLREAIYAIASGAGSRASRELLNSTADLPAARPQLTASGALQRQGDAKALLATIARQAVELLGSSESDRIRRCEGDGCAILFLDLSRSGERRWCSMSGCGNRAKARAFRNRRSENDPRGQD